MVLSRQHKGLKGLVLYHGNHLGLSGCSELEEYLSGFQELAGHRDRIVMELKY